jgi:hypothetical protein
LPERDLGTQPGAFPVCTTCHVPVTVPGTGRGARRHVGLGLVQTPRSPQLCAFAPARGRRWCKTRHSSVAVPGTGRGCRVLGVSRRVRPGRLSVFPTRDQAGHRHTKGGARPGVRVHHPRPLTRDEPEFDPETSPRRASVVTRSALPRTTFDLITPRAATSCWTGSIRVSPPLRPRSTRSLGRPETAEGDAARVLVLLRKSRDARRRARRASHRRMNRSGRFDSRPTREDDGADARSSGTGRHRAHLRRR